MSDVSARHVVSDPGLEQVGPLLRSSRLRNVLRVNAVVSGLTGLTVAVGAGWIGDVVGVSTIAARVVGIGLVLFAVGVGGVSGARHRRLPALARLIGVADAGWVAATAVFVAGGAFTRTGSVVALAIGVVVAGFAVLELRGASAVLLASAVADVSPPLEAISASAEVGASAQHAWDVVTDHELPFIARRQASGGDGTDCP
jgi:hypothetical protein